MTEKLKSLMDEVTAMVDHEFALPDLEAIVHDGNRTARRRRVIVGVGGLVAAVTVTAAVLAGRGLGGDDAQVADIPVDSVGTSWSVGSVIHTPQSSIDVRHPVRAYVRTTAGYVTVDDNGRVWSVVGDDVTRVGQMEPSSLYLASDTEDSLAAWLEHEPNGDWTWVVFDQRLGHRFATFVERSVPDLLGVVVALDDRHLYVSQQGEYRSIDVANGSEAVIDRPVRAAHLLSVEDGVLAWEDPGNDDGESEYIVGRADSEPVRIPWVHGSRAVFSPDARLVSFDADEPRVFDVATGQQVDTELDDWSFAVGYEWLDDHRLAFLGIEDDAGTFELQVCDLPDGRCDPAAAMDGFGERRDGFSLAVGEVLDGD